MNEKFVYLLLFVLLIILIGFIVWSIIMYNNLNSCLNDESPYCPQLYCDTPSTLCENMPYRTDSNGNTSCAYYLLSLSSPIVVVGGSGGGGG